LNEQHKTKSAPSKIYSTFVREKEKLVNVWKRGFSFACSKKHILIPSG